MRRSTAAAILLLTAAPLLALHAGCTSQERPHADPVSPGSAGDAPLTLPAGAASLAVLAPVRIRLHPLTRLERDPAGRLRLVCYLELADRWGHSCKWLGHARIELYRPSDAGADAGGSGGGGGGVTAGGERQENVWNVDLADPEKNALTYDWVTHTYRLELVGLPDWVEHLQRGDAREPWATVRAYFLAKDPGSTDEKRMEASFRIRRGTKAE
jgi:hypothetical protein